MRHFKLILAAGALGAASILLPPAVLAQSDAAAAIQERQAIMKAKGGLSAGIKSALENKDLKTVATQAKAMNAVAVVLPNFFPAGSGPDAGKTRALAKIWEDQPGFMQAAQRMADTSAALATAAEAGNQEQAMAAFAAMGKDGCGGCHTAFRAER